MKKVAQQDEKVVVLHRYGVNDSLKNRLWNAFKGVYLKPVHADSVEEEFTFKGKASYVICLPEVSDEAENFAKRWPYETKFLVLGQPARKTDSVEFVESIEQWKRSNRKKELV